MSTTNGESSSKVVDAATDHQMAKTVQNPKSKTSRARSVVRSSARPWPANGLYTRAVRAPMSPSDRLPTRVTAERAVCEALAARCVRPLVLLARRRAPPAGERQSSADVSLVLLPVFVVDQQGRAVRGLRADDFRPGGGQARRGRLVPLRGHHPTRTRTRSGPRARRAPPLPAPVRQVLHRSPAGSTRARARPATSCARRLAPSDLAAVATIDVNHGVRSWPTSPRTARCSRTPSDARRPHAREDQRSARAGRRHVRSPTSGGRAQARRPRIARC